MISIDRILGFVEGEGCFSIMMQKNIDRKPRKTLRKNKRVSALPFRVVPNFRITACEKDRKMLEEIKEALGIGAIYTQNRTKYNQNHNPVSYYYTRNFEEALKVKEFFKDKEFLTTKGQDFQQWCKCLEIIQKGQHLTKKGLLEICTIRDQMNTRKNKNTRTFEMVKDILEKNPEHIEAHQNQTNLVHNTFVGSESWFENKKGRRLFHTQEEQTPASQG
ncbi:MAG TPA: hypothetical protein HA227_01390 [Candidatus Diapherotrites archaeon]|uniref:Homing endonuclease LAGLIDADG domain-containing protein n=1 Tax=Candidatus Iainarchaeum sp. TaxID=3101447 RepID=A0A7J4KSB3_9ARCH|nr:hypothetical protein [Candidatus Diapherotrites archaeon]